MVDFPEPGGHALEARPVGVVDAIPQDTPADTPADAASETAGEPNPAQTVAERVAAAEERYFRPRMSLRELSFHSQRLDLLLDASDGELVPELETEMDAMLAQFAENADYVGDHRQAFLIEIDALAKEGKRVQERKKKLEKRMERWETRVIEYLRGCNRLKLTGEYWNVTVKRNAPSLKVRDDKKIGEPYRTEQQVTVTEVTVDNAGIKAALLAWEQRVESWEKANAAKPEAERAPYPERPFAEDAAVLERSYSLLAR